MLEKSQIIISENISWEQLNPPLTESDWLQAIASNPAFDFLKDPEEDIYSPTDGKPFNQEEDAPAQAENLANIRDERWLDPANHRLPSSLTLLQEDRER